MIGSCARDACKLKQKTSLGFDHQNKENMTKYVKTTITTNKIASEYRKPANLPRDASQHGGCQYVQSHHWVK